MSFEGWQCPPEPDKATKVSFACPILNEKLGPAIRVGNIMELCGEAGSAKTQFCLDLALETARKNADSYVLFIVTERAFPSKRIDQMLTAKKWPERLLDRIIIKNVRESAPFFEMLEKDVLEMSCRLSLMIVDSIAGPIRAEYEDNSRKERVSSIHKLGYLLNNIARKKSIPIIVTNQVTALIDQKMENYGRDSMPCFGINWSNYIHSRIFLIRTDFIIKADESSAKKVKTETRLRKAEVDFSPVLANSVIKFVVDDIGVRGVEINVQKV